MGSHNNWPYLLSLYLLQTYAAFHSTRENEHNQKKKHKKEIEFEGLLDIST